MENKTCLKPPVKYSECYDIDMGVSENVVYPKKTMVLPLLIIIPFLNGYHWEYTLFSDKPK